MKFIFINDHRTVWPVCVMCRVLRVARSGYYAWRRRGPSARSMRRTELAGKIRRVHSQSRGTYGSPRVHRALAAEGERVCENTVAKIMQNERIAARKKRKFVPRTTDSTHDQPIAPNVLNRQFIVARPDTHWVADITYLPTATGWLYLAAVLDLCTRKIVGWSMADHLRTELAADALRMALDRRNPAPGLLLHSDRGVQYASDEYQRLMAKHGLTCSMSGVGDCWDNAVMESFFSTLKTELVHQRTYATHDEARASVFEWIEVFYNRQRLHSTLGYQSPEAFEKSLT